MLRGNEVWILVLIALLLFGGKRLPDLARGLGKSLRIFKTEVKNQDDPVEDDKSSTDK